MSPQANTVRHVHTALGWVQVTLVHRSLAHQTPREYYARTRLYVSVPTDAATMPEMDDDKAWARWNRQQVKTQRGVIEVALPTLRELLGEGVDGADWRYSRNAGCACGCSPGFRDAADHALYHEGSRVDVYVSLDDPTRLSDHALLLAVASVNAEYDGDETDPTLDDRSQAINAAAVARWGADAMDDLAEQVVATRMTSDEFVTWARRESRAWLDDRAREAAARG
jgi:hypothetical protein